MPIKLEKIVSLTYILLEYNWKYPKKHYIYESHGRAKNSLDDKALSQILFALKNPQNIHSLGVITLLNA